MPKFHLKTQKAIVIAGLCGAFSLLAAGCSGAAVAKPTAVHSTVAAPCATASLVLWLNTQGNGAAGSVYYMLNLTNLSNASCSLTGYSGVSGVTLTGSQVGSAASRNPSAASKTITIAPGGTAQETIQIVQAANYPAATCALTTAAGLRVFPPNQTTSKIVPFPFTACSKSGPKYMSVEAVQK